MRKLVSILLTVAVAVSLLVVPAVAGADPEPTLTIGDICAPPGGTVTVPIVAYDIDSSYEVMQASIELKYDPSVVIATGVVTGDGPPVVDWNTGSNIDGSNWLGIMAFDFANTYEGDIIVAYVTFEATGNIGDSCGLQFGDWEAPFTGTGLANFSGVGVPLTIVDGTFTIVAALLPMSEFQIDKAKIDFGSPGDDEVGLKGTLELDLINGDGVDISEDVIVTVGPLSDTITMVKKGKKDEKWEYKRPEDGTGSIEKMTIKWKTGNDGSEWKIGKFDMSMDKADLSELTNPVTISIQIGDDFGEETILMRVRWDYKGS